jgi:hypothetical protein
LDIEIFTLLKEQVIEVFTFLLVTREFALEKGLQEDVKKIDSAIADNNYVLLLTNKQLSDLNYAEMDHRIGLFDVI